MRVYFISGLGADERVFQFLNLPGVKKVFVRWLPPEPREPLAAYCARLLPQFDLSQEINLVGISFGGIVAQETARLVPCRRVVLLSSIKGPWEMDWKLRLVARAGLYRPVPAAWLQWSNLLTANYYFGVETRAEAALLRQIILDTDSEFSRWAIAEIMTWAGADLPAGLPVAHLHGGRDRIFPAGPVRGATLVPDGGHFTFHGREPGSGRERVAGSGIGLGEITAAPAPRGDSGRGRFRWRCRPRAWFGRSRRLAGGRP